MNSNSNFNSNSNSNSKKISVGVVGATGVVGETFLLMLDQRDFPFGEVRLFASDASKGMKRKVGAREFEVTTLSEGCFEGLDIVFFSSGDDISLEWAPKAAKAGAIAIDNSGAFRMREDINLNVPEVNGDLLPKLLLGQRPGSAAQIIANPNCSTIQLVVALKPLADRYGLESVRVSSYQSVSGAGRGGLEELLEQTKIALEGDVPEKGKTFPKPIAFNSIPQIGGFRFDGSADDGFCTEEIKIMNETRKILGLPDLRVSAFTVRVPTLNSHAETVWATLKNPPAAKSVAAAVEEVEATLAAGAGLEVFRRSTSAPDYPTQSQVSGEDPVFIGRVHKDPTDAKTWMMWVVSDNLRKGAALNGIQIAEKIYGLSPR